VLICVRVSTFVLYFSEKKTWISATAALKMYNLLIVAKLASTQVTYNDVFHVNPVSNNRQETLAAPISFRLSKPALLTSIIEVCKKGAQTVE
jgi:hypothetical protein